ncbi:hypothetical protein [Streptomyces yangpuensis]
MTSDWLPDRGIRRTVRALGTMWPLGPGVRGIIAAMGIEIVHRP